MNAWNVYPRPQLVRKDWLCLNGEWNLKWEGQSKSVKINVPFCPESELSGVVGQDWKNKTLTYERSFAAPAEWLESGKHLILHFGAVDQEARVYVNGKLVGEHKGGYLPFSMDITDAIKSGKSKADKEMSENAEDEPVKYNRLNKLRVEVVDSLNHKYPWGKQKEARGGMWYTPVSGIWQSVWLEPVAEQHIESLKIDTGLNWVEIRAYGIAGGTIELLGEKHELIKDEQASSLCASIHIDIRKPLLWSPEDPYLYDFSITSGEDSISSYFALRTLSIAEFDGYKRLCLNGKPYFFNGLLDQGYWPDGIYTPSSPLCYEQDILAMKSLGFNTLRKHIKLEPEQFYYDCDRLGMVVFQDMVNNGEYNFMHDTVLPTLGFTKLKDTNFNEEPETREFFLKHMVETVKQLYNHPSICYWTIFNEGWGQFCADEAYDILRELDGTRFIDTTSGWFTQSKSDVDSHHVYFRKIKAKAGSRPLVISEFGGYACKLPEHCFNPNKTYGYRKCKDEATLLCDMAALYTGEIYPLMDKGLSAAIYTQLSDVEDETNGLLSYDRQVQKFKAYTASGRVEIIGNHTDHQGGRVLVCPTNEKIRAYVAENHSNVIRVISEGFEPIEVQLNGENSYEPATTKALILGILAGFADMLGEIEYAAAGFDCYIRSEVGVGSGLSSSAAFEILLSRIINDRFYNNQASDVDMAKISFFAEKTFFGKQCGMQDQLAISLGKLAMLDFSSREPEYETIDFDFSRTGYRMKVVMTESDHADLGDEYDAIPTDMLKVASVIGIDKLGDISTDKFYRLLPKLEGKVKDGTLTELQLNRARHYYDETERVLTGATALQAGNFERFLACVDASGLSSEQLLQNVLPKGVSENDLSRKLAENRAKPGVAAVKLEGGGFGGSILVFEKI